MDNNLNIYNTKTKISSFIKADDGVIINEKYIRWIKKIDECLYVCTNPKGCNLDNTHKICKINSTYSYNKFDKYFDINSLPGKTPHSGV